MSANRPIKFGKSFQTTEVDISSLSSRYPLEKISKYIKKKYHPTPEELLLRYKDSSYRSDLKELSNQKLLLLKRIAELEKFTGSTVSFDSLSKNIHKLIGELDSSQRGLPELRKKSQKYMGFFKGYAPVPEVVAQVKATELRIQNIKEYLDGDSLSNLLKYFGELDYAQDLLSRIDKRILRVAVEEDREKSRLLKEDRQKKLAVERQIKDKKKAEEQAKKEKKKDKDIERLRSLAAATVEDKRKLLSRNKKYLTHHNQCPYCGSEFNEDSDIHTDHIYPLSKGGLEDEDNLVLVCASCNLKKSDYTLREFIVKFKLNREKVEGRLELLGKRF